MNYTTTTVTAANLEWAVRKNIRDALAALATKVNALEGKPLLAHFDGNDQRIRLATTDGERSAVTLSEAQDLLS